MDAILNAVWCQRMSSYNNGAGAAVVVYDILMLMPQEVTHIWSSRWSTAKVLYLLARYWGAFHIVLNFLVYAQKQDSLQFCRVYFVLTFLGGSIVMMALVHCITMMRLYALYDRSKLFLVSIGSISLIITMVDFILSGELVKSALRTTFLAPPSLPFQGCLCGFPSTLYLTISWVDAMFLSILLFAMMLCKFRQSVRRRRQTGSGINMGSPVFKTFINDGTFWFFLIVVGLVLNVICMRVLPLGLEQGFLPWLLLIQSMSGSRLILNLRETAARNRSSTIHGGTWYRQSTSQQVQQTQQSVRIVVDVATCDR